MMYVWKRCIGLVLAVMMIVLSVSALVMVQTLVYAWDSADPIRTARELGYAVDKLPSSPKTSPEQADKDYVKYIAGELSNMNDAGKRGADEDDLKKLSKFYNAYFRVGSSSGKDDIDLTDVDETSSGKKIQEDESYVYGYCAVTQGSNCMEVEQPKASGSVKLAVKLLDFDGPVYVDLTLKNSPFSSSKDYYMKFGSHKLDVKISGDHVRFVAPEEGTYKLYEDDDDDDGNDDYDYNDLSTFWQDVVDDIDAAGSGSRVRVSMGSRTSMPTDVLRALKGKAVTLALTESNGNIISIYGKDVKIPSGSSVSLSTLRSTYDKDTSQSTTTSSSSSGGLPVSPLPGGVGGGTGSGGVAGTVNGSTGTPNAGGGPASPPAASPLPTVKAPASTLPVSPLPKLPSASSSSSSDSSSSEESSSEPVSSEFDTDFRPDEPEAETVNIQEPIDLPQLPKGSDTRIGRVVNKVGMAGVLAFIGLAAVTAALGGGLLSYAILSRKNGK